MGICCNKDDGGGSSCSNWREAMFGKGDRYNYGHMCVMNNPFQKDKSRKPKLNFYGRDENIPIMLSIIMGLQHCFAMVGGLVTPPLVIFRFTVCGFPFCPELEQYAVSAALITSGICTLINVSKFYIPFSKRYFGRALYIGSGVLSVMGTSFTFLPIFEIAIAQQKQNGIDGRTAYGNLLGTSMVCCLIELIFSFLPIKYIKGLFPPLVTATTVILIGVALVGTGMKYWGGGVVCAEMGWKTHVQVTDKQEEYDFNFPPPSAQCINGETTLYYGAASYIGLGFSVLCFLVVIELFGSVFMKNCNVILALLFGYFVAGVSDYNGLNYINTDNIKNADPITFLWVETFPIGFYGPAVIPMIIAYLVTTVETVGDLTAVFEASDLSTEGEDYESSIQGGLTCDGVCSILAALCTTPPNTTFSQNNGVIALTKCASRRAGYACGGWLILLGVFGKVAGIITSIPDCVLGGMTIFLFANVLASGITLMGNVDLNSRRNKFILALSLAIGVGVTVWPYAFLDRRASPYTAQFWQCEDCSDTLKGVRNGVSIFLSTGYCVGTVVAMLLNAILPEDTEIDYGKDDDDEIDDDKDPKAITDDPDPTVPLGLSQRGPSVVSQQPSVVSQQSSMPLVAENEEIEKAWDEEEVGGKDSAEIQEA